MKNANDIEKHLARLKAAGPGDERSRAIRQKLVFKPYRDSGVLLKTLPWVFSLAAALLLVFHFSWNKNETEQETKTKGRVDKKQNIPLALYQYKGFEDGKAGFDLPTEKGHIVFYLEPGKTQGLLKLVSATPDFAVLESESEGRMTLYRSERPGRRQGFETK